MKNLRFTTLFTVGCLAVAAQSMSDPLPTGTRIEVRQGANWKRAVVSEDKGPASPTVKVRLDPNGESNIVPRNTIRPAPRPGSIQVGDRLEWYGNSVTSFRYKPAVVKGIGTGNYAGYYLMASDDFPNSPTYAKKEQLWLLPESSSGAGAAPAAATPPTLGKYRCFASNGKSQLFMTNIELRSGGTYVAFGKAGRYSFDAATAAITWESGWAQENQLMGKVEGNAVIRIKRNAICSHE